MAVIGDLIVGIEYSDDKTNVPFHGTFSRHGITRASSVLLIWLNENVRFHQKDTLKRFFERFEQNGLTINRFKADCGSCFISLM